MSDRSTRLALSVPLSLLLAACGGGGGGGGGGSSGGGGSTPTTPGTVTSPDGQSRQVSADCSFSQNLGSARGDGLRIQDVKWLQSVALDADDADSRMVAGKSVRMRIDVLADSLTQAPSRREIMVHDPDTGSCTTVPLTAPSSVPTTTDVETLNTAFTATIPANLVKPGMAVSVVLDDASGRSATEADRTYRVFKPRVAAAITETVRIIPISFGGSIGYVSDTSALASVITRMHPISNVNVVMESTYAPPSLLVGSLLGILGGVSVGSYSLMQSVLDNVDDRCAVLNGSQRSARSAPKCIAVFPDNLVFKTSLNAGGTVVGIAFVGGVAMVTQSLGTVEVNVSSPYASSHWLSGRALTLAHEFGHLLDLDHGDCGGAGGIDGRLYSDGRLGGGAGYDAVRNAYFSSTRLDTNGNPMFADLMSYCGKEWSSDRGYLATLNYRAGASLESDVAAREEEDSAQWLKVSQVNGAWKVRRVSFAPATLNASAMSMQVSSDQGVEDMALASASVSESGEQSNGPYYINLRDRKSVVLRLLKAGKELKRWNAADI